MHNEFAELIRSARVSSPTQEILLARLNNAVASENDSQCSDAVYVTLTAISQRLIPQGPESAVDLAAILLSKLCTGSGNGWRYAEMPPDPVAFLQGLFALEESSQELFGRAFSTLAVPDQIDLLARAQKGELHWALLNSSLWFEELLSDLVEAYVSQPAAMSLMGFDGFAFLPRWEMIGLDTAEPWEPQAS